MVAHGDHAHYFYKKDLSPQEIAAAEATLAGKKEEDKGQPLTDDVATYSRDASDEEKIQYISDLTVSARPLRFQMALSLTIQTKNTIRPTSILMPFGRNMSASHLKLAILN